MRNDKSELDVKAEVLTDLFLVTGRIAFDDDDTVHVVQASPEKSVSDIFKNQLLIDAELEPYGTADDLNENIDARVFVVSCEPLANVIAKRLT